MVNFFLRYYIAKWLALGLVCLTCPLDPQLQAEEVDFSTQIQPILARKCFACHGPDHQEAGLRFDDRSTTVGAAESGKHAVVPGQPASSEMLRRITSTEESERMPPEGKRLTESEVKLLTTWIETGAEFKLHWSFQPIRRPALPTVNQTAWPNQPIDHFVLAKLESRQLSPATSANPADLVRRAYLDITGLPPAPQLVADLTAAWNEMTYPQLVDRLLADPALGERWARTWLDVVRYAESNSFERDNPKPNAWRYRDYVIDAFSSDKPYDQFVREQLAGDELKQVTQESLTATGYYRLGIWDDEPADPLQARFDEYDDIVSTTSQAFLALTLNCARCHDHKIDPITQRDYYSMVALMRDVTSYASRGDQQSNNQLDLSEEVGRQYDQLQADRKNVERRLREIEKKAISKMDAPDQRATEGPERGEVLKAKLQQYVDEATWLEYQGLKEKQSEFDRRQELLPARVRILGLGKCEAPPPATHVLTRGSPHAPADEVQPAFPKLLGGGVPELPTLGNDARSAGRRRLLADWIASKDNWMTARVIVNRIWMYYFGRGIVRSPNNFGLMGEAPTHPELLDYLASELMRHDWNLKTIHRIILLSSSYQMSSASQAAALAIDPNNDLFWRQNVRRLSAEQLRDSILAVTGQLNEQQFGPSMYPKLSAEVLASQSRPGANWEDSSVADQSRRSIYIHVKRSLGVPLLTVFDFPDTDTTCEARFLTTQPGQALSLLNSDWMQEQARHLLERVARDVGDDVTAQARRCLELVSSMPAELPDVEELLDLVKRLKVKHQLDELAARQAMCLVALNLNQLMYVD
jgi:mono/diheme cytochrome c family protein